MKKIQKIIKIPHFWIYFLISMIGIFALELLFLGLWTIPIIDYRIPFMGEITPLDIVYNIIFAVIFAFGFSIFLLAKKFYTTTCAIGSSSGLLSFFTLLCPICPVFFLSYFGLSTSVSLLFPYFWPLRIISLIILIFGITILLKRIELKKMPVFTGHLFTQQTLAFFIVILLLNNQAMAMNIGEKMLGSSSSSEINMSGEFAIDVANLVTPNSLPFYGSELGLDFSSISAINTSVKAMSTMAPKQGSNPIALNDEEMKRYIKIGTEPSITCEFCCGVKTLVREDGSPTCGCAHSIAMRGTTAYLIQNYPNMSNEDISYEIVRQKGLYFPKQMQKRMAEQLAGSQKDFTTDIKYLVQNLTKSELMLLQGKSKSEGFIPSTKSPDMVGGC